MGDHIHEDHLTAHHLELNESGKLVRKQYTKTWEGEQSIELYDTSEYVGAEIFGRIDNGTIAEMVRISIVNFEGAAGLDVQQIGVSNDYIDLTITAEIADSTVSIVINNNEVSETNTFVYSMHKLSV